MEKGINLQIEELKQNIVKSINDSHMPITIANMILQGLLTESSMLQQQIISQEKQAYEKAMTEENKEVTK
jgi:hypothetical protein